MINLYGAQLESVSVHKVGNSCKKEGVITSNAPLRINDETTALLKEYFFKPFRTQEEHYYHFDHEVALDFNLLYHTSKAAFNPGLSILDHDLTKQIAKHLYAQSKHPHIKSGDLFVVHISNILLDNKKVDGIGIFKSEIKEDFFQIKNYGNLDIAIQQGINVNKLDKGCLILNTEKENGYKVLSVDNNKYDTKYWLDNFLGVSTLSDSNYKTKKYLKFCQDFAKDVVVPLEDKQQEVLFLNRAVNHFAKHDVFDEEEFLQKTLPNADPLMLKEFEHYKTQNSDKYGLSGVAAFDISNKAVSDARKKIKNVISLDTNVTIKLDFINPESASKFLEKGWDEERQMYYYLVYFNKETK